MQLVTVKNCYDNGVMKFVLGSIVKWLGPLCHTCQPREKFWRDKRGATERSERSSEGGSGSPPPENLKKPTLQIVQSTLFLSYICEYY